MVSFNSLVDGDVVVYANHPSTNPDYFGHEAVVLGVFGCGEDAYVKLEVAAVDSGEKFVSIISNPARLWLRDVVSDDDANRFLNEF